MLRKEIKAPSESLNNFKIDSPFINLAKLFFACKIRVVPDIRPIIFPDIRLNSKYRIFSQKKIKKCFVFNITYQHFLSLFHSYFILSEKVLKKVAYSKFA